MAGLRSFDAFAKPVEGLKSRSAVGGIITMIAGSFAALLFLSQVILYARLETRQHFELAQSYSVKKLPDAIQDMDMVRTPARIVQKGRMKDPNNIKLSIHVSFPYLKCPTVDISMDGASGSRLDMIHGRNAIQKRPLTKKEIEIIQNDFQDEKSSISINAMSGCTLIGTVYVPRVGGSFAITLSKTVWHQATNIMDLLMNKNAYNDKRNLEHNATHYIHNIEFGSAFPHLPHPLSGKATVFNFPMYTQGTVQQEAISSGFSAVGLSSTTVKLVHIKYKRFARSIKDMYQMSVAQHTVTPNTLASQYSTMMPGMSIVYDFTPFSVFHSESRENLFLFLGSLVSIVGGVFVTVGLVSRFLLSAVQVGKKTD